ncbi:DUF6343 family protein [Streptomyces sp. ACA25]|uniref:DUF6343 family protein n=1 Tax=Streptomyces sp. ACA25 TaxID=3022596 RepID=UPI0023079AF2|nr:DUF6343 family protein [Streptomyces sp. ACA25]MDB1086607.1 DUF6343 family protein [Streptomyces sp. ACA25]
MSNDPRREPVPRSRSGFIGRRSPRTGTEPVTAQSHLQVRLLLSLVFLPLFVLATVVFAVWWAGAGAGDSPRPEDLRLLTLLCGGLSLLAAVDLAVVLRRLRRERGSGPGAPPEGGTGAG